MKIIFKISFLILFSLFGLSNVFAQNKSYNLNDSFDDSYKEISINNKDYISLSENAKRFRELIINPIVQNIELIMVNDTILLDLFFDIKFKAYIDKIDVDVNGTSTVRAQLVDSNYGYCVISTFNGKSLMTIEVPEVNELFMSKYDNKTNKYYLLQIDKTKQKAIEGSPSATQPADSQQNNNYENKAQQGSQNLSLHKTETINSVNIVNDSIILNAPLVQDIVTLLIVYTPAAATWSNNYETNINNTISLLMAKAQLTLDNSNTLITLQLVHSEQVSYTELNTSQDLYNLTGTNDGFMDNVHSLRDTYCADVVVLLEHISYTGGQGWLLNSTSGSPAYAFSLTRVQQASWTYTVIHEIGHNMGCHHHKEQTVQPGPGLWSYSAGWRWTGTSNAKYCSVMTYQSGNYFPDGVTHTRVPYFSNPSILYQGVATGDAVDADNARDLRQTKSVVAAYRSCAISPNLLVQNTTINNGQSDCYNATNTITVAGSGTTVNINSGAEATFIAGEKILFETGFSAHSGSHTEAYITTTGNYCNNPLAMMANNVTTQEIDTEVLSVEAVDDINDVQNINIYPNPTTSNFTIDFLGEETSAKIILLNFQGNQVYNSNCNNQNKLEIITDYLTSGVYIILIKTQTQLITKKLIKLK